MVPQPSLLTHPLLQAIRGEAFDRHLLGLKLQAIEDLVSMPDIFMDTSYAIAMHFNLSTSQVGTAPEPGPLPSGSLPLPWVPWGGVDRATGAGAEGCTD